MKLVQVILFSFTFLWLMSYSPIAQAQSTDSTTPLSAAALAADSQNMRLLGHLGGSTNAVSVVGNRAYIGEGPRLTILDISNGVTPTMLGKTQPLANIVEDVEVVGNTAYVADGESGLFLFDVSNPAAPAQLGVYDTVGSATSVFVSGTIAYIANGTSGLRVINVANASAPTEISFFDTAGTAEEVVVVGNTAYLADGGSGLRILNVASPAAPTEIGFYDPGGMNRYASCVFVVNHLAYVCDGYSIGMSVIDVTTPASATQIGFFSTSFESLRQIFVTNNVAYLVVGYSAFLGGSTGVKMVDVSNPISPTLLGKYNVSGRASGVFVRNNLAYVADQYSGLNVVNVSNPVTPIRLGAYGAPGGAASVHLAGNTAYIANLESGLRLINVASPANPVEVGSFDTPSFAYHAFALGNTAYVADGASLQLVDVANPAAPTELGAYNSPGTTAAVYVANNRAYLADLNEGLRIVNVSNLASPTSIGVYTSATGLAENVFVAGSTAYIAYGTDGLRVVNVSNPAAPVLSGSYNTPGEAWDVQVQGIYAYVADTSQGLRIINLNNFTEAGFYDTPGSAYAVYVVNNLAYIADGTSGVRVINVANPAAPSEVGFYDTPGSANDVFVAGNTIYVADGSGGLFLLRYPACYKLTLNHSGEGANPTANPPNSPGCNSGEYLFATSISVSANPLASWRVAGWVGTNNDSTTAKNNVLTMPAADHDVSVIYAPTCYALTLTHSGNGNNPLPAPANSVGCAAGQYVAGATITLTAAAGTGYTIGSWSGTVENSSVAVSNLVTMPASDHSASVAYVLACYPLTLDHSGNGSDPLANPAQSSGCALGNYHFQETITLAATPDNGWQVTGWSGTVNNTVTGTTNSLIMPAGAATASVHYNERPTAGPGDLFELDNDCTRSRPIANQGDETQTHTFHLAGDVDWVRFDATAGVLHRIEVQVPITSPADVVLEVYPDCASAPPDDWKWNGSFAPGARLDINPTVSGPIYVRITNADANVAGPQVNYQMTVRKLGSGPTNRALIIVAGRLKTADRLQANINNVASAIYRLFQRNGYNDENIYFLATDPALAGYDAAATRSNLQAAITQWAAGKVGNGVLTIYMIDHGAPELFYLDEVNGQRLTPSDLNDWLTQLEGAAPGVTINVIIEACQSGSFVATPGSISKSGRVIVTSTSSTVDAKASKDGAYFSDHLLTGLQQGHNLAASFADARTVAQSIFSLQDAWLDANGNGIANEFGDATAAAQRGFAYAGTFAEDQWPPHIFSAKGPTSISNFSGQITVDARDDVNVRQVWAVVYPPDYAPPATSQELLPEVLPTVLLTAIDNQGHYAGEFSGFTQAGVYRIVIQAEDNEGLVARPVVIEVQAGSRVYLPLVVR